eukprot:scaffold245_cov256-Pinguiococcus_pyrenoidosus.AAC.51
MTQVRGASGRSDETSAVATTSVRLRAYYLMLPLDYSRGPHNGECSQPWSPCLRSFAASFMERACATDMIVTIGLIPSDVGSTLPSMTYRFLASRLSPLGVTGPANGPDPCADMRQLDIWCALKRAVSLGTTPSSPIPLTYRSKAPGSSGLSTNHLAFRLTGKSTRAPAARISLIQSAHPAKSVRTLALSCRQLVGML